MSGTENLIPRLRVDVNRSWQALDLVIDVAFARLGANGAGFEDVN